jgi:hypothetical protein
MATTRGPYRSPVREIQAITLAVGRPRGRGRGCMRRLNPVYWIYLLVVRLFVGHDCDRRRDWLICRFGDQIIYALRWVDP